MSRRASTFIFFLAFSALLFAIHLPFLNLPYFWDELGQFAPSAIDIYRDGSLVPHTALPNVHPPGVMLYVALVWRVFGYSIPAARLAMLVMAAAGALFAFLLAIRLARKTEGAPAFAAILFLFASPLFYTQAMMIQLDMPAMVFTTLALLLFLDERYAACAAASTVLVLVKETSLAAPMVFAAWLIFKDRRYVQALYFVAPAAALGGWLLLLHHWTGYWLGSADFERYNLQGALNFWHIFWAVLRRAQVLFISDGHFLGTLAIFAGAALFRTREWRIATVTAGFQVLTVSVLGGAILDRYLLPTLPILYAAMACGASVFTPRVRHALIGGMAALLVLGLFWNPPYPFPYENNLAMVDFTDLQKDAAVFLEDEMPNKRILSAWPFTDAVKHPECGYVTHPLPVVKASDFQLSSLAAFDRRDYDVVVFYSREWIYQDSKFDIGVLRPLFARYLNYHPQASREEVRAGLDLVPLARWDKGGQWIEIYAKAPR